MLTYINGKKTPKLILLHLEKKLKNITQYTHSATDMMGVANSVT